MFPANVFKYDARSTYYMSVGESISESDDNNYYENAVGDVVISPGVGFVG